MPLLERVWEKRNRAPVLLVSGVTILIIALADWWTAPYMSLGFLYLFPIMLAAGFLPRTALVAVCVVCAVLTEIFSSLDPAGRVIRLILRCSPSWDVGCSCGTSSQPQAHLGNTGAAAHSR